jgi:YHS domain-containing protein
MISVAISFATAQETGPAQAETQPAATQPATAQPTTAPQATTEPASTQPAATQPATTQPTAALPNAVCPVSGDPALAAFSVEYQGKNVYFCCAACPTIFLANPERYLAKLPQFGGAESEPVGTSHEHEEEHEDDDGHDEEPAESPGQSSHSHGDHTH